MKAYFAIVKAKASTMLHYRAAMLAGVGTQIFWGFLNVAILTAFYGKTSQQQPLSLSQAIAIMWLSQTLLQLLPWVIDPELEELVKNGNVSYELARPINLYWAWFFRSATDRLVPALLRSIPIFLIAWLFFDLRSPASLLAYLTFPLSIVFAALLSGTITTLIVISLFWTTSGEGIQKLMPHTSLILSGVALPLPLFPDWLQPFLSIQPLRGITDIPSRIYTGVISGTDSFLYLGFQLAWSIGFILLGKWLMQRAIRQFVIQGG